MLLVIVIFYCEYYKFNIKGRVDFYLIYLYI